MTSRDKSETGREPDGDDCSAAKQPLSFVAGLLLPGKVVSHGPGELLSGAPREHSESASRVRGPPKTLLPAVAGDCGDWAVMRAEAGEVGAPLPGGDGATRCPAKAREIGDVGLTGAER